MTVTKEHTGSMNISLGQRCEVNLQALLESRLLIQANSGGGKSWLIRKLLEESHGKVQQIVLDLEGEFGTLREKYDYILAGKGGDTPAEPKSAALLARKLLELNVSAIIDLYELKHHERKSFVRLFLDSMVNAPKECWHHVLVVVDEAHVFVPEKGESEAASAVIDLATRGRKRGFCAVLATQRLSKMHKDAAAECNNKLIGRTGLDIDMKRASEELGFTSKEQTISLRNLEPGEFFAFGPAISKEVERVTVGNVHTSHPKVGDRVLTRVVPPTDAIKRVLSKLADLPGEAKKEAQTIDDLKAEIRSLRAHRCPKVTSQEDIDRAVEQVERKLSLEHSKQIATYESTLTKIRKALDLPTPVPNVIHAPPKRLPANPGWNGKPVLQRSEQPTLGGLTNPEKRILNAIALMESIGIHDPEQVAVAFLAGYTIGGGAFNNPKGSLRSKGLIEYMGDRVTLTSDGRELADPQDIGLTADQLQQKVYSILPGPERKLLEPLVAAYPEGLTNEELAEQSGYQVNGGAYNNPRGRLRSLGLIEYTPDRKVRAKSLLFLE